MAGAKAKKRNKPKEEALGRALERLRALFPNKSPSCIRRALARVSDVDPVDEGLRSSATPEDSARSTTQG